MLFLGPRLRELMSLRELLPPTLKPALCPNFLSRKKPRNMSPRIISRPEAIFTPARPMSMDVSAALSKLLDPFYGADNISQPDSEFFVYDHCFSPGHQFAVDMYFQGFSSQFVQFND